MPGHPHVYIHPEATGLAKALVNSHRAEQPLKLYGSWLCPFVQRVWLTLEEKRIPYQYIEVDLSNKPQEFVSLNPRGMVPTLSCPSNDGSPKPLYESTVIMEYLEEAYPEHTPQLLPSSAYERAYARLWIDYVTNHFVPAFQRFRQYQPQAADEDATAGLEKARQELLNHLKVWAREMHPDGPFFKGSEISLIDLAFAPWVVRLPLLDKLKPGGLRIPSAGQGTPEEQGVWNRWWKWADAMKGRKSLQNTTSEQEYYFHIYKQYEPNAEKELA